VLAAEEDAGELVAGVQELVQGGVQVRVGNPDRALAVIVFAGQQGRLTQEFLEEGGGDAFGPLDDGLRSTRPGRAASAGSSRSARLVVSRNVTSALELSPSISLSNWNNSGCSPGRVFSRCSAIRSTSSTTIMAGCRVRATEQASLIRSRARPEITITVASGSRASR